VDGRLSQTTAVGLAYVDCEVEVGIFLTSRSLFLWTLFENVEP
jgi:hypothetical protein